ncbi:MAG: PQQ-dependent dehydrogenase, methanol/ethanol family [Pseudomonadales bacterium]
MTPSPRHCYCLLLTCLLLGLAGCEPESPQAGDVDDARVIAAPTTEPGSWLTHGQTYKEQRFSKLTQINPDNIDQLGLAWHKQIGDFNMRMQGTPLVVDGVMYVTNGWSVVYALDAATGTEIWRHDPQVDRSYVRLACCGPAHNRGVAVYRGKIYVATFDGRLIALNAADGSVHWDIDTWHPAALGRFNITGAPRAARGKVFIGQGSSESGHRRGYVTAYDAETGAVDWRFYLVPGDPSQPFEHPEMEMAAKTWGGEWWKYGGGGTAWHALVYDEELGSLYIGVGNGAPWPRDIRSPGGGDDLFLTAIISVDVETGRMNWYYQTVPGDNWDYSSAMDITLSELVVDGKPRKVLLQAPKNGFFYVIDRENGELLRAHPYTDGITWATHVDLQTGRPVENPDVVYEQKPQWILPANAGAHNWEPQSWDEANGIMYFYYHDMPAFYSLDEAFVKTGVYKIRERGLSLGWGEGEYRRKLIEQSDPPPPTEGYIGAFDPLTGQYKWRHQLKNAFNGGVLATASDLLIQGEGDGRLVVRSTDDGLPIWEFDARGYFTSAVMSYAIEGTQYIATMVSGNRARDLGGTLLVFKLGGKAEMPATQAVALEIPAQPEVEFDLDTLLLGESLYQAQCANCHGGIGVASEVLVTAPDLRTMDQTTHNEFIDIVRHGTRMEQGMAGFAESLSDAEAEAIRHYLIREANALRAALNQQPAPEAEDQG